jgi:tetratricopeptide (TPR) repeat protein
LWAPAAQIHTIKNQFVGALRQFTESVAGTFGDEGPRLTASVQALRASLGQWDAAIAAYERLVSTLPDGAELHVAKGTVYLDRDRREDALREFAAAGRLDPRRADVFSLKALALSLSGKPGEAADALRAALALSPGDPLLLYGLGQQAARAGRADQSAAALRDFQDVEWRRLGTAGDGRPSAPFERVSLLRQAPGVAPIFPLNAYRRGFSLLLAGKYAEAVEELGKAAAADAVVSSTGVAEYGSALKRGQLTAAVVGLEATLQAQPASSEAARMLGVAYWVDGQFAKSAARLRDAIRIAPQDERARVALANVLADSGQPADAESVLTDAIRAMPDAGQAHYRLAQLYQSRSLLPDAVREFARAAALDPLVGLDRLYETIGGLYANQAKFDSAVSAYLIRIDASPNNADAHKTLGEIYFLQGRNDEALAEFAAAVMIDPRQAGALVGASQTFLRLGRFDASLEWSKRALALDDRLKDARYALAMSLMRLGQTDDGRRELEVFGHMQAEVLAATRQQSELNTARRDAAESLANGDYPTAVTALKQAIGLDPDAASAYRDLGLALAKTGHPDDAILSLQRAAQLEDSADSHQLLADIYRSLGRLADSETEAALAVRANDREKVERLRKISGAR